jgi:hypothetical protein
MPSVRTRSKIKDIDFDVAFLMQLAPGIYKRKGAGCLCKKVPTPFNDSPRPSRLFRLASSLLGMGRRRCPSIRFGFRRRNRMRAAVIHRPESQKEGSENKTERLLFLRRQNEDLAPR